VLQSELQTGDTTNIKRHCPPFSTSLIAFITVKLDLRSRVVGAKF